MYRRILVPLENSAADRTILAHVGELALFASASVLLVHVADGWVARHFDQLNLRESEEMQEDRSYLDTVVRELAGKGIAVEARLAMGDPASEIIRIADEEHVDLIAMATHGHRFVMDLLLGSTVGKVRHIVSVPVLLVKAKGRSSAADPLPPPVVR
jgi:nucleotide-binding universal stress UspA family protein